MSSSLPQDVAEKVKERLKPLGYTCSLVEEHNAINVVCSPEPMQVQEIFNRDKINKIEVFLPKGENLANIGLWFQRGFRMKPEEISKVVAEWFHGDQHISESHFIEAEFRDGARESVPAIVTDIIRERRKPLVLPHQL